eukprot:2884538-Amphidinium_carterae.1
MFWGDRVSAMINPREMGGLSRFVEVYQTCPQRLNGTTNLAEWVQNTVSYAVEIPNLSTRKPSLTVL